MTKVNELHKRWLNDSSYKADSEAIIVEFEIASTIIEDRNLAGLTQSELVKRLKAKQSLVARLESRADNTTQWRGSGGGQPVGSSPAAIFGPSMFCHPGR